MNMDKSIFNTRLTELRNSTDIKRRRWNPEEVQYLERLFNEGYGISYIAVKLHRTEVAVYNKIRSLDLYSPKTKSKIIAK